MQWFSIERAVVVFCVRRDQNIHHQPVALYSLCLSSLGKSQMLDAHNNFDGAVAIHVGHTSGKSRHFTSLLFYNTSLPPHISEWGWMGQQMFTLEIWL